MSHQAEDHLHGAVSCLCSAIAEASESTRCQDCPKSLGTHGPTCLGAPGAVGFPVGVVERDVLGPPLSAERLACKFSSNELARKCVPHGSSDTCAKRDSAARALSHARRDVPEPLKCAECLRITRRYAKHVHSRASAKLLRRTGNTLSQPFGSSAGHISACGHCGGSWQQ